MEYSPLLYLRLLTGTDSVSQEHFNFNFATVDTALQDFKKTLDSFDPEITEDDLKKIASFLTFSSETLEEIGASVLLNSAQLETIAQHLSTEQLDTLASFVSISTKELEGMVEKLTDSQLETMGKSVSLTETQIETFLGDLELTESQLASIINGADESTLQEIADKISLSVSDLQEICKKLTDSQLETMGKSVSLTEAQIQAFLEDVELTESQLASIVNGADDSTLQEIADKIVFSADVLDSLKGEKGDSGEFTEEQKLLVEAAILGATEKQDRLSNITETTELLKESDSFFVLQDGNIKKISPENMSDYLNSFSPLPESGRTLDGYSWEEIWQIANLGKMEDYFQIGDRKTWVCNAVSTTIQIAGFWHDVKNAETGQRANVSFVLNDYIYLSEEELTAHFEAEKREWIPYDVSCFSLRDLMWTEGDVYQRLLPDGFGDFITPIYKNSLGGSGNIISSSNDIISTLPFAFFPLGYHDVFVTDTLYTDRYTEEEKNHYYPLLNGTTVNKNILYTQKTGEPWLLSNMGTASTKSKYLSTSGVASTSSAYNANTTLAISNTFRHCFVGFSMG